MVLIPWKPYFDLEKFFEEDDWFLPVVSHFGVVKPAIDIYETEKNLVVEVNVPDCDPKKIEVSVKDGVLRVSGGIDEKKEEKDKGYWRKEIRRGTFERMVRLPIAVKESAVEAVYEKGLLKITIPKAEVKPASKVKIKIKEK